MNQKNLITQLYSKKASPFINPNKKAIIKNLNSIKIIILVVVFLMFSLILGISVYANDTNNTKKFWLIDKAETSPIIFIATKGEVQKNDFLTFLLDSDNCDEVGLSFQVTSVMESVPTKDHLFQVLVKHNPGFEYVTKAGIVDNYDLGDAFYSQFIFANILSVQEVLEAFSQKESFEIELQYSEEAGIADPYLFFDITTNKWDISDLEKHLLDAQKKCRYQFFDMKKV